MRYMYYTFNVKRNYRETGVQMLTYEQKKPIRQIRQASLTLSEQTQYNLRITFANKLKLKKKGRSSGYYSLSVGCHV